ncbi:MAG: DNA helicase UvrD [Candidatus Aenigmarchaeota archaeon]|nr:DNA helicase UvrD [Candidatus Aenigmarchaeota archaeon]
MTIVYADLHLHSKYSRATSKDLDLDNIAKYGRIKGLNLMGSADFTHPKWLEHLKQNLSEHSEGIYEYAGMNFMLSVEISLIYTQGRKQYRIHHIILAPNFEVVDQINEWLDRKGRRDYDGRPIFGFNSMELVENLMSISKDIEIIPAHIWTPFFSLYGSQSGFNSIKDCFGDHLNHIHAIETGLSSDPSMNWRISELDDLAILSFSDAHSHWPWRLGRECCVFDMKEITYKELIDIIRAKDKEKFLMTLEFFPEEGKYHYDGHRNCGVSLPPKESIANNNLCPKCLKELTIGVLHRVEELADREEGFVPENAVPFKKFIPLNELIAVTLSTETFSKKVWEVYNKLINRFGNEFNILLNVEENDLSKIVDEKIADAIIKNRNGNIKVIPGYDGVYGKPVIGETFQKNNFSKKLYQKETESYKKTQKNLGEFLSK